MDAGAYDEVLLTIPPKAEYLVFCRLVLAGIARGREIEAEAVADLKLAVTEACSNSIRHAYVDSPDGDIQIRYRVGHAELTVEVVDTGAGIDLSAEGAEEGELTEEGMGLAIIRSVTDELELSAGPEGRGSRVRFTKYLS